MMFYEFITLEELMKQFNPNFMTAIGQASISCSKGSPSLNGIIAALTTCDAMELLGVTGDNQVPESIYIDRKKAKAAFSELHKQIEQLGLDVSAAIAKEIVDAVDAKSFSARDITNLADELCKALKVQMRSRLFYSIDLDKQGYITDQFGDDVTKSFPSAAFDIQEASQCLAFDRWTAVVFHLGRVAEIATVEVCRQVGYDSPKPSFSEALNYIDSNLGNLRGKYKEANPSFKGKRETFSKIAAHMHDVNDAWRSQVAHMDKKYTGEEAVRIWDATKALMQQLATKLKKTS